MEHQNFSFTKEYEAVLKSLGSGASQGNSTTINYIHFDVDKNNNISNLYYTLVFAGNTYKSVVVEESYKVGSYLHVIPELKDQSSSSLFNSMGTAGLNNTPNIDAKLFFEKLDTVTVDKLKFSGTNDNQFMLRSELTKNNYLQQQAEVYSIEESSAKRIEDNRQTGNILTCSTYDNKSNSYKTNNYLF